MTISIYKAKNPGGLVVAGFFFAWSRARILHHLPVAGRQVKLFLIAPGRRVHDPAKAPWIEFVFADQKPHGVGTASARRFGPRL